MDTEQIIKSLTLVEKAALLQGRTVWTTRGISRLGIPGIFLSDGPHGLRKQAGPSDHLGLHASVPATCFPTAATMANSWDVSLGRELGRALGEEAAANNVHVVLGPGLNIKRSPLCGRNFEYFSEDPYLAGKMAASYIKGIQENGVCACPKHFAANSQELRRMNTDSVVDERTLREIYLTGFEIAVREGHPKCIMSSYNLINGTYANENRLLLTDILRNEWGFDGFVVTDWGADNNHTEGVRAGSNLVMPAPGPDCAIRLINSVMDGTLSEEILDQRLSELLPAVLSASAAVEKLPKTFDAEAHHSTACKCAEGSIVLLENDGILPLCKTTATAVIGDFAAKARYQGAGSSLVNPTKLTDLKSSLETSGLNITGFAKGYSRTVPKPDPALIGEAAALAEKSAVVLLCVGLDEISESEGMDRNTLKLSEGQQALIREVCRVNNNVILVLSGGAPFMIPGDVRYRAVIHGYLGGQAGASAMAEAILGLINPSGKLNETWPEKLEDTPAFPYFPGTKKTSEYREGLFVGYRYYDTAGVPVRYPFGYGLSYTTFEYSNLTAERNKVSFTLSNTGGMDGAEVAQVYIGRSGDGGPVRPVKELKGFQKVFLKSGESKTVTIELDDKAFRYYNVKTGRWETEAADYTVYVSSCVSDVRLTRTMWIDGEKAEAPVGALKEYDGGKIRNISDAAFEALLGRPVPDGSWGGLLTKNDALCQMYYARSAPARLLYKFLTRLKDKAEAKGTPDLNILFVYNMPFRSICKMTNGMASAEMVDDILIIVNGHFFKGTGRLIADFFRNRRANRLFMKQLGESNDGKN